MRGFRWFEILGDLVRLRSSWREAWGGAFGGQEPRSS